MMGQAHRVTEDAFTALQRAARDGVLLIAQVFAAMNRGEITPEQCKELVAEIERGNTPLWRR